MFKYLIGGKIYLGLLSALISLLLTACGGGGGGTPVTTGVNYTGLTTQAVITAENAEILTVGAYQLGQSSETGGLPMSLSQDSEATAVPSRALTAAISLQSFMTDLDLLALAASAPGRQVITDSETIPGACGGSSFITLSLNQETGNFNGSISYTNFDDCDGVIINGTTNISGNFDLNSGFLTQFNMTFSNMAIRTIEGDAFTMAGSMNFTFSSPTAATITMNLRSRDDNTNKVYQVVNLVISLTDNINFLTATMNGRYYDPDYGYVELTTDVALEIWLQDEWPVAGKLRVLGAPGSEGGNTWATLEFSVNYDYRVEADTTGNGSPDFTITRPLAI